MHFTWVTKLVVCCVCMYVLCVWEGGCFSVLLFLILADLDGDNGYLEAKRANREVKMEASFSLRGDLSYLTHIPPVFQETPDSEELLVGEKGLQVYLKITVSSKLKRPLSSSPPAVYIPKSASTNVDSIVEAPTVSQ